VITATEAVVFQLLGLDDTDAFRDLGKLLQSRLSSERV